MAGTLHNTIELFHRTMKKLQAEIPLGEVERIATMIHKAMTSQARSFHTPEHIFDLADGSNPIQDLAALFHDIVYYSVDRGFIPEIKKTLSAYVRLSGGTVTLKEKSPARGDLAYGINCSVFGFKKGQELPPFGGMNEFMSSLVLVAELQPYVGEAILVRAAACIEATIPFRGTDKRGRSPADQLAERLEGYCHRKKINMPKKEITKSVQRAVDFANRDVENFAEDQVSRFLDNTWKLLPETNPSLRSAGTYTIEAYREALQKMEGFMLGLDYHVVFGRYEGVPSKRVYARLVELAERNILAARDYLGIKLLTAGILEAIARISGGDAPIALFMGDIGDTRGLRKFEKMLPESQDDATIRSTIHDLLERGRSGESDFDLGKSPLANYFYLNLGADKSAEILREVRRMFSKEIKPAALLDDLPAGLIVPVIEACAAMAFTREKELRAYVKKRSA